MIPSLMLENLGWTIVHSLWQGMLIGLLALVALQSGRAASPRIRHAIAVSGLLLMMGCFIGTFVSMSARSSTMDLVAGQSFLTNQTVLEPIAIPTVTERTITSSTAGDINPLPIIGWIWITGICVMSSRLLRQWLLARRLRVVDVSKPDTEILTMFQTLKTQISIADRVGLLISRAIDSPMVVGWFRPVVLVPAAAVTSLTTEQLESILVHELAHISRRDHLSNFIQAIIEVALFFHPVTWWLSAQIRVERENCCDDAALMITGSPRSLAEALLVLETLRLRPLPEAPLLAATGGSLMHRVSRLFENTHRRPTSTGWKALSAGTILAIAGISTAAIAIETASNEPAQVAKDTKTAEVVDFPTAESMRETLAIELREGRLSLQQAAAIDRTHAKLLKQIESGEISKKKAASKLRSSTKAVYDLTDARKSSPIKPPPEIDLAAYKVELDQRLSVMALDFEKMVELGNITQAEADARYQRLKKRMATLYREVETRQRANSESEIGDSERSRSDHDQTVQRMIKMVESGEITREQMQMRLDRMKRMETRAPKRDLEELKTQIEERIRAMGADLRTKVAAGEISEEDARARFQDGEKKMWARYRDAEKKQMEADAPKNPELEALKKQIEERIRAMGADLRTKVAAGEISEEDARDRLQDGEKRMWARYRAAEMKQMEADAPKNPELEALKTRIQDRLRAMGMEIRKQVTAGEITAEEGREKFAEAEKRMSRRVRMAEEQADEDRPASDDLDRLKARIEDQIKANVEELDAMVEDGKISEADAKARYEVLESRLWKRYRAAEEGGTLKDAEENRNIDLEELKAGIEERIRAMGADLRTKVAAGEISEEDARARFQDGEKRMWSRYRAAEMKRMEMDSKPNETKKISEEDFESATERMAEMVRSGDLTLEAMLARIEAMQKTVVGYETLDRSNARAMSRFNYLQTQRKKRAHRAEFERLSGMVERGNMTPAEMQERLAEIREKSADDPEEKSDSAE